MRGNSCSYIVTHGFDKPRPKPYLPSPIHHPQYSSDAPLQSWLPRHIYHQPRLKLNNLGLQQDQHMVVHASNYRSATISLLRVVLDRAPAYIPRKHKRQAITIHHQPWRPQRAPEKGLFIRIGRLFVPHLYPVTLLVRGLPSPTLSANMARPVVSQASHPFPCPAHHPRSWIRYQAHRSRWWHQCRHRPLRWVVLG